MNHDAITVTEIDSKDFHFVKLDEVNQNKFSLDENEDEKQVNVRVDAETCAILGLDFETSDYCEHVPYFESLFHKELPFNTLTTKLTDIIWTWGGISIYLCFVTKRQPEDFKERKNVTIHFGHNEAELKYGDFRIKGQIPLKTISELLFNNDVFTIHDVLPLLEPCDDTADYDGIVEKLKACNAIEASANDKASENKDAYLDQFLIPPHDNPDYAISLMRNANSQSLEFQLIYNNVHLIQAIKKGRKAVWEFLESAPVIKLKEEFLFCYQCVCLEECLDNDVSSRKLSLDVSLQRLEKACCLMSSKSMAKLYDMYKSVCSLAEGQYSDSSHSKLCGMANKYSISDNDFQGNIELLCRVASIVQDNSTSFSRAMSDLIGKLELFFQKREEYPSLHQMDEDSDMLDKRDKFCEEFESGNYDARINGWLSSYGKEFAEAHSKLEELKKALAYLPGFRRVIDEIDAFISYREFDTLDFLMYKTDDYDGSRKKKCIYSYPRNIHELGKLPDAHHNVLIAKFEEYLKKHSRRKKKPNVLSKAIATLCGCLHWRPWHRQPSF